MSEEATARAAGSLDELRLQLADAQKRLAEATAALSQVGGGTPMSRFLFSKVKVQTGIPKI